MTHQEKMDYLKTIQERNQALIKRLNIMVRDTAISESFSLLGQILVDQGLADTRAGQISDSVIGNDYTDYDKLILAICNCDGSNFPHLLKIAPRLIKICLENKVDLALIERTEDAFNQIDRRAS